MSAIGLPAVFADNQRAGFWGILPNDMGKVLLYIGGFLILLGLLILFGGKFLPLGRLPGDIHWEGTHGTLYVPAGTCILLSRWVKFFHR